MPRLIRVKTTSVELTTPVLDQYGIESGQACRFRHNADGHWTRGVIKGDAKDGSLSIVDQHGRWRAIMPENVQLQKRGPRGGALWIPVVES